MPDIFSRAVSTLGGVFTADRAKLAFAGVPGEGDIIPAALVQQISVTYNQAVTRLYEVGSANIYYVGGRTQGQAQIQRIIGPSTVLGRFYEKFGDVCKAATNNIILTVTETDCSVNRVPGQVATSYQLRLCVLTDINMSVNARDMIIGENCQLMFSSLIFSERLTGGI